MSTAATLAVVVALMMSVASLAVSIWALLCLAERDRREDQADAELVRRLCPRGE